MAPLFNDLIKKQSVHRSGKNLNLIDRLIAEENFELAFGQIKKTVVYDPGNIANSSADLKTLYQNVLSRILVICEEKNLVLVEISALESLFLERVELLELQSKSKDAFFRILQKREKAGKSVPTWSKTDYRNKEKEIKLELKRNKEELEKILDRIESSIQTNDSDSIVYH